MSQPLDQHTEPWPIMVTWRAARLRVIIDASNTRLVSLSVAENSLAPKTG